MELGNILQQLLAPLLTLWPLTLLMVVLLIRGLLQLSSIYRSSSTEEKTIKDCIRALPEGHSTLASRSDMESQIVLWMKELREASIARSIVVHVYSMRRLQNPDVGAVTSLTVQTSAARLNNLRGLPNLLFIAGLLGTVWGLSVSVGSLSEPLAASLDRPNPIALTERLSITLGEMQGAFAFTLLGVLFSGIISFLITFPQASLARLSSVSQDFTLKLAEYIFPSSQAAQLEDLQRILLESRDFMGRVTDLMSSASGQFEKVLNTASQQMTNHISHLNLVSKTVVETLSGTMGDVRKSTAAIRKGAEELHKGVERLSTGVESLRAYQDDLRDTYTNLQQMFQESQQALQDFSKEQAEKLTEASYRVISDLNSHTREIIVLQERLDKTSNDFKAIAASYDNATTSTINQLGHGFRTVEENLGNLLRAHREEMGGVEHQLTGISQTLDKLSSRLDPRLLPKEEWTEVIAKLGQISSILEAQRTRAQKVEDALLVLPVYGTGLSKGLGDIREALGGIEASLTKDTGTREDFSAVLSGIASILTSLRRIETGLHAPSMPDVRAELPSGPDI